MEPQFTFSQLLYLEGIVNDYYCQHEGSDVFQLLSRIRNLIDQQKG